jgi:hypothetical protein
MEKLPNELTIEINKFLKNKYETNIMYSLVVNCYVGKIKPLKRKYICMTLKLIKWYLKYFKLNFFIFENDTSNTFGHAALNGNLKNMKWLKENNCP